MKPAPTRRAPWLSALSFAAELAGAVAVLTLALGLAATLITPLEWPANGTAVALAFAAGFGVARAWRGNGQVEGVRGVALHQSIRHILRRLGQLANCHA